jgi:hypothetical protein
MARLDVCRKKKLFFLLINNLIWASYTKKKNSEAQSVQPNWIKNRSQCFKQPGCALLKANIDIYFYAVIIDEK